MPFGRLLADYRNRQNRQQNMMNPRAIVLATALAVAGVVSAGTIDRAIAATAEDLNKDVDQALQRLYKISPVAEELSKKATAVLVFPNIVKAGLVFGGAYGEGELKLGSKVDGYYNSVTGTWGFQAGAESYAYAVFLMTEKAVDYIHTSHGWEVGVGPTVVVVNQGIARNLSTSTLKDDAYAFIFDQQGLYAGVDIEGTKISLIKR
jgi:lipid-binding SYLF domain-containing protein